MRALVYLISGLSLAALLNGCNQGASPAQRTGEVAHVPAAPRVADDIGTRALLEQFYTMHLRERSSGVPEESQMAAYRPFLSQRLLTQLEQATHQRDQAIAEHPDEKPPFVDGDMFTSLFEGATAFEVGVPTRISEGRERVPVNFSYSEAGASTERWTDFALLVREDGGWKLDDVEYAGDWDFASKGRLSKSLSAQQ